MATVSLSPDCGPGGFPVGASEGSECYSCPEPGWSVILLLVATLIYSGVIYLMTTLLDFAAKRRGSGLYVAFRLVLDYIVGLGTASMFFAQTSPAFFALSWLSSFGFGNIALTGNVLECAILATMGSESTLAVRTILEIVIMAICVLLVWIVTRAGMPSASDPRHLVWWLPFCPCLARKSSVLPDVTEVVRMEVDLAFDLKGISARHLLDLAVRPYDAWGVHSRIGTAVDSREKLVASTLAQPARRKAGSENGTDSSPRQPSSGVRTGVSSGSDPALCGVPLASVPLLEAALLAAQPEASADALREALAQAKAAAAATVALHGLGPDLATPPPPTRLQRAMIARLQRLAAEEAQARLETYRQEAAGVREEIAAAEAAMADSGPGTGEYLRQQQTGRELLIRLAAAEANIGRLQEVEAYDWEQSEALAVSLEEAEMRARHGALATYSDSFVAAVTGSGIVEAAIDTLAARVRQAAGGRRHTSNLTPIPDAESLIPQRELEEELGAMETLQQPLTVMPDAEGFPVASVGVWADARLERRGVSDTVADSARLHIVEWASARGVGCACCRCIVWYLIEALCCFNACDQRPCGCHNADRSKLHELFDDELDGEERGGRPDRRRVDALPVLQAATSRSMTREPDRKTWQSVTFAEDDGEDGAGTAGSAASGGPNSSSVAGGDGDGSAGTDLDVGAPGSEGGASLNASPPGRGSFAAGPASGGSAPPSSALGPRPTFSAARGTGLSAAAMRALRRDTDAARAAAAATSMSQYNSTRDPPAASMLVPLGYAQSSGQGSAGAGASGDGKASSDRSWQVGEEAGGPVASVTGSGESKAAPGEAVGAWGALGPAAGRAGGVVMTAPLQMSMTAGQGADDDLSDGVGSVDEEEALVPEGAGIVAVKLSTFAGESVSVAGELAVDLQEQTSRLSAADILARCVRQQRLTEAWTTVLAATAAPADSRLDEFDDAVAWACKYEAFRLTGSWPRQTPSRHMQAAMALRLSAAAADSMADKLGPPAKREAATSTVGAAAATTATPVAGPAPAPEAVAVPVTDAEVADATGAGAQRGAESGDDADVGDDAIGMAAGIDASGVRVVPRGAFTDDESGSESEEDGGDAGAPLGAVPSARKAPRSPAAALHPFAALMAERAAPSSASGTSSAGDGGEIAAGEAVHFGRLEGLTAALAMPRVEEQSGGEADAKPGHSPASNDVNESDDDEDDEDGSDAPVPYVVAQPVRVAESEPEPAGAVWRQRRMHQLLGLHPASLSGSDGAAAPGVPGSPAGDGKATGLQVGEGMGEAFPDGQFTALTAGSTRRLDTTGVSDSVPTELRLLLLRSRAAAADASALDAQAQMRATMVPAEPDIPSRTRGGSAPRSRSGTPRASSRASFRGALSTRDFGSAQAEEGAPSVRLLKPAKAEAAAARAGERRVKKRSTRSRKAIAARRERESAASEASRSEAGEDSGPGESSSAGLLPHALGMTATGVGAVGLGGTDDGVDRAWHPEAASFVDLTEHEHPGEMRQVVVAPAYADSDTDTDGELEGGEGDASLPLRTAGGAGDSGLHSTAGSQQQGRASTGDAADMPASREAAIAEPESGGSRAAGLSSGIAAPAWFQEMEQSARGVISFVPQNPAQLILQARDDAVRVREQLEALARGQQDVMVVEESNKRCDPWLVALQLGLAAVFSRAFLAFRLRSPTSGGFTTDQFATPDSAGYAASVAVSSIVVAAVAVVFSVMLLRTLGCFSCKADSHEAFIHTGPRARAGSFTTGFHPLCRGFQAALIAKQMLLGMLLVLVENERARGIVLICVDSATLVLLAVLQPYSRLGHSLFAVAASAGGILLGSLEVVSSTSDYSAAQRSDADVAVTALVLLLRALLLAMLLRDVIRDCSACGGGLRAEPLRLGMLIAERAAGRFTEEESAAFALLDDPCCGHPVSCWRVVCRHPAAEFEERRLADLAAAARASLTRLRFLGPVDAAASAWLPGLAAARLQLSQGVSATAARLPLPLQVTGIHKRGLSITAADAWLAWGFAGPCGRIVSALVPDRWLLDSLYPSSIGAVDAVGAAADGRHAEALNAIAEAQAADALELGAGTARFGGGWEAADGGSPVIGLLNATRELGKEAAESAERTGRAHDVAAARVAMTLPSDDASVSWASLVLLGWCPSCFVRCTARGSELARSNVQAPAALPAKVAGLDAHEALALVRTVEAEVCMEQSRRASAVIAHDLRVRALPVPDSDVVLAETLSEAAKAALEVSALLAAVKRADAAAVVRQEVQMARERTRVDHDAAVMEIQEARTEEARALAAAEAKLLQESLQAERDKQAKEEQERVADAMREERLRQQQMLSQMSQVRKNAVTSALRSKYASDPRAAASDLLNIRMEQMHRDQARFKRK